VERILTPYSNAVQSIQADSSGAMIQQFLTELVDSSTEAQVEFALAVLKKAAAMALAQRTTPKSRESPTTVDVDGGGVSFANVAREYSKSHREMLQRVAQ
jgi:hypothetical protein